MSTLSIIAQDVIVSIISPNLQQALYAFYGMNRIGAIANMLQLLFFPSETMTRMEGTEIKKQISIQKKRPQALGLRQ